MSESKDRKKKRPNEFFFPRNSSLPKIDDYSSQFQIIKMESSRGFWLILSDIHIPEHDNNAIRQVIRRAKKMAGNRGIKGIILNGDIVDFYGISRYLRDPRRRNLAEEIKKTREFLRWLSSEFPRKDIIFKSGNHEERLISYIITNCPELFEVDTITPEVLFSCARYNTVYIGEKSALKLGKLYVFHGHEIKSFGNPVNPSRWLLQKTNCNTLVGHFHTFTEYFIKSLDNKLWGCWTSGCLCLPYPAYFPINNWQQGCYLVELSNNGEFLIHKIGIF